MPKLPWDAGNSSAPDDDFEFDETTPEQRITAAQAISIQLLHMSDSLKAHTDPSTAADRDYADCLAGRLRSNDPSIDDIWIAAELLREHVRRTRRALARAGIVSK